MPVREWDMGKRGKSRSPQRVRKSSRSASRERKRPRRSQSPGLNRRRHSRSPHHGRSFSLLTYILFTPNRECQANVIKPIREI